MPSLLPIVFQCELGGRRERLHERSDRVCYTVFSVFIGKFPKHIKDVNIVHRGVR